MSFIYVCDYCGEPIDGELLATLEVSGLAPDDSDNRYLSSRSISGYVGHYHTSDESPCWWKVLGAVTLTNESGPSLATIPTLSDDQDVARRRKHTRP